ncbi:MAG: major facilitator superfamily domain-containing protein [Linnemannia gamsii]|nr:MAG: major facilitator superfamily domain-containing protein [Linnemannia gamsii]
MSSSQIDVKTHTPSTAHQQQKLENTGVSSSNTSLSEKTTQAQEEPEAEETLDVKGEGIPTRDLANPEADESTPPPMFHKPPPRQFLLIMIALALCVFLASLDQIIVSTSIPAITVEYNSLNDIAWLGTAYMMTSTAFQPLYGKISDIFGRKATVLFANTVFLVGSAISGWATSMIMLIVGRAVAGIGAGGLMAMVFIIMSDMLDMRERGKYIGMVSGIFSLSSVLGPLLGGAFSDHITWRWSFWINLPIGAISTAFIAFNLDLPTPNGSFRDKIKRVDFYGSFLLLGSVMLLLLPLSWGGNKYAWNSGIVIGLLVAGFAVAVVFILVEWKVPNEPILPIHLFKIRNIKATYGALFFNGMAFFGVIFYLPIYFQVILKESATVGGLETVPFVIGIVITSVSSGIWVLKRGTFAFMPAVGNFIFMVGVALCLLFKESTPRVATILVLFLCGMGAGFTYQASTLAVQSAVKPKYMATVTASIQFIRSLGQVFGIAIVGSIFNNKLEETLHDEFPTNDSILRVMQDYKYIDTFPDLEQRMIYGSFVRALNFAFYCSIAACAFAFLSACFIEHKELKTVANQHDGVKPEITVDMA